MSLTAQQLDAAVAASVAALKVQLRHAQQLLFKINEAQEALEEQLNKEPGKYQILTMEVGSISDFHRGLTDRIGADAAAASFLPRGV